MGNPFNCYSVSMYGPYNSKTRAKVWKEISLLICSLIMCGDFNMVETLVERFQGLGRESKEWSSLLSYLNLVNVFLENGLNYNNKQLVSCYRATRS